MRNFLGGFLLLMCLAQSVAANPPCVQTLDPFPAGAVAPCDGILIPREIGLDYVLCLRSHEKLEKLVTQEQEIHRLRLRALRDRYEILGKRLDGVSEQLRIAQERIHDARVSPWYSSPWVRVPAAILVTGAVTYLVTR
jgi:hypothetical protein